MTKESPISRYLSILPEMSEARILRLLIEVGLEVTGSDEGSLLVLDESSQELVFAMTAGSAASEEALIGQRVPVGKGVSGLAAMTREVQTGAPTFKDIKQVHRVEVPDGTPSAILAAPMLVDDTVIGVITAVSFDASRRFGDREMRIYGGFATIAGLVVQQRQRLALSTSGQHEPLSAQKRILDSVQHIVKAQPDQISRVADLLAAIEQFVRISDE